jgi:hypothetical protein
MMIDRELFYRLRRPMIEQCERRLCLSRIAFSSQDIECCRAEEPDFVVAADLDGDADLDVLYASRLNNTIAWNENTDGQGNFGTQQIIKIEDNALGGGQPLLAADVDGDSDLDVLVASPLSSKIDWYENTDGKGTFGTEQVISTEIQRSRSVVAADLDGDGDLDVLSASYGDHRIAWYEQRLLADANDDGSFDSSDLVRIFQAGEYEDAIVGNSTFDEGDWNGDGEFDSGDLVLAFQAGHYERAAEARMTDIAAAVDQLFAEANAKTSRGAFVV